MNKNEFIELGFVPNETNVKVNRFYEDQNSNENDNEDGWNDITNIYYI